MTNPWDSIDHMPWHDALIEALHLERIGEDWCVQLYCEIHDDEDLAYFQPFQLEQRKVIIHFNDIRYYSTVFRGFYESLNTYLDTWQIIRDVQVIQPLLGEHVNPADYLLHHITTTGGSVFDIICTSIEVTPQHM